MIAESLDKSGNIYHIDKSDIENRGINNIGNHTLTKTNNKVLKPVSISDTLFSNKYELIILKVYKYNAELCISFRTYHEFVFKLDINLHSSQKIYDTGIKYIFDERLF